MATAKNYTELKMYQLAYESAIALFWLTRKFPKEEVYSLTSQLCRASRSIGANIVEGWSKRSYPNVFKRHIVDSIGSCDETRYWLKVAKDCKFLTEEDYNEFDQKYEEVGKMLGSFFDHMNKQ